MDVKFIFGWAKDNGIELPTNSDGNVNIPASFELYNEWKKKGNGAKVDTSSNSVDNMTDRGYNKITKSLSVPEGRQLREKILADTDGKMSIDEIVNAPVIKKAQEEYEKSMGVNNQNSTHLINTPEREKIRRKAADEILQRGSINESGGFNGKVTKGYRAEIVIGAPAGGKSSVIVDKVSKNTGSKVLDSDEIKALIPEFDGGNGAGKVHKESADIILNQMVIPEFGKNGKHRGENIVIPIVGKSSKNAVSYLKTLKEAGYEVHLSFNDVSPLNSVKRAATRYIEKGRFLSPSYIKSIGISPQETYKQLKQQGGFDSYTMYNNDVSFGQSAKKIERTDGNGNKIKWEDWQ